MQVTVTWETVSSHTPLRLFISPLCTLAGHFDLGEHYLFLPAATWAKQKT